MSNARTGLASMAARSAACGGGPTYGSGAPMEMTWGQIRGLRRRADVRLGGADGDDVRDHLDAERLLEEVAGDGAGGDAGRGLAGAGALQHRAGVVEAVLEHARVVGVAGPGPGQRRVAGAFGQLSGVDGVRRHHRLPLGPLGVADLDRDRPAQCDAVAHPGQHRDQVLFELHPGAAAVPQTTAGQLCRDVVGGYVDSRDHAFDHGHQGAAV
ncbi:hypothetical protein MPHL43072_15880 [Mycolicibacterium phlei DSM 43072]|nr:hypothetical protein MPHL43072_15880 [Mycolicibacterium phlei DSM 43072]